MGSGRGRITSEGQPSQVGWAATAIVIVALIAGAFFGIRTYGTYRLLQSATQTGVPSTSGIRPWMTIGYVAGSYDVAFITLVSRLQLSPDTDPKSTLKDIADRTSLPRIEFTQRVQRAVADTAPIQKSPASSGWLATLNDSILSLILTYGYVAFGTTLLLAALGLPLPSGIAVTIAGSLLAQGKLDWALTFTIGIVASLLGDIGGYVVGRVFGPSLLANWGPFLGLSLIRQTFLAGLLSRWGASTVFLSRTLISTFSTVVSLLAGVSRYSATRFAVLSLVGRSFWTFAYLWLGYTIGTEVEAAASFLRNLSGLLFSLLVLSASFAILIKGNASRLDSR
ncbi:MAG TPA: DedA family protein [Pseudolabrys sp.]|nr:DedA family protein [Pseudolabrys sp.]